MFFRRALSFLAVGSVVGGAWGCGSSTPAAGIRPTPFTATSALGDTGCSAAPLVVDLPATERVAVESALASGRTLLARHDCTATSNKLTLLANCELFDGYDYAPLTRREEVVLP